MIQVGLTWPEVITASFVGVQRRVLSMKRGSVPAHGYADDSQAFDQDIQAACSEMAVAKALRIYWPAVFGRIDTTDGDVGFGAIQVRSTRRDGGCLILHPEDPDEHVFVLVTGAVPHFKVHGWLRASVAKTDEFWREDTGRPAYFVPQHRLLPVTDKIRSVG